MEPMLASGIGPVVGRVVMILGRLPWGLGVEQGSDALEIGGTLTVGE